MPALPTPLHHPAATPSARAAPRPLRLTAYTDAAALGGAEESLGNLLAELGPHVEAAVLGVDAAVVARVAARRPGTRARVIAPVRHKRDLRAIAAHLKAVRALRPDVLHANLRTPWQAQWGIFAGLLSRGVRVVAVEQLPLPSQDALQRRFKRLISRRLSAHVAVGVRAAREVEAFAGLPTGSVGTVYNGVPAPREPVGVAPSAPPSGGPVVGSLGRLDSQKGYDVLIRALTRLPGVGLTLVGDGPEREALERLADSLGVADRVRITGWLSDARAWLRDFDVFALPSRYEGFPVSIVEAMLAGLPVVATPVGSVAESVIDGSTGVLVPCDDDAALATALDGLLADPLRRHEMGERGRALAQERFTADAMARAFEGIYEEIRC